MGEKAKNAYANIHINDEGGIEIDTNLNALGVVHMLAVSQQVIIQNHVKPNEEEVQEEE